MVSVESITVDITRKIKSPEFLKDLGFSSLMGDLSLCRGLSGLLLFFKSLANKGLLEKKKTDQIIHNYVLKIKEIIEFKGVHDFSLFSGLCGVCFAIQFVSTENRYQRILGKLQAFLIDNIKKVYLLPLQENITNNRPSPSCLYDVIQGICGVGRYCIMNSSDHQFYKLSNAISESLVLLTQPLNLNGKHVPGWYLSPKDPLYALHPSLFSRGSFNLGLAHGIPGILSFLSIAFLNGINVKGGKQTIKLVADWIKSKSFLHEEAIRWPYSVSWEEEVEQKSDSREFSKDAWCYGVPGIARSLLLAGKVINDKNLKQFAIKAFKDVFSRSSDEWQIPGPNLCHGTAGLLLITSAFSKEKDCNDLVVQVDRLKKLLLSQYNPIFPLGFKDLDFREGELFCVTKLGLLEGTIGILLTLLTLHDSKHQWSIPFLIDE